MNKEPAAAIAARGEQIKTSSADYLLGPPTHVAPRLRLCAGQQGARY